MSTPEVSRLRSLCSSPSPPLHCLLNSRRRSVLLRRLRAESPSCTTQRQWEGFLVCCSPLASGLHDPPLLAPTDSDGIRYVRAPPAVRACHCTLVAVRVTSSTGAFPLGDFTNQARGRVAALEPEPTSPRAALLRFGLGSGLYLSGESSAAREQFEAAVESAKVGQPFLRMISQSILSIVTTDEGRLEEAESLAREARTLVESFGLQGVPQSSWVRIALGYMLARQGIWLRLKPNLRVHFSREASYLV